MKKKTFFLILLSFILAVAVLLTSPISSKAASLLNTVDWVNPLESEWAYNASEAKGSGGILTYIDNTDGYIVTQINPAQIKAYVDTGDAENYAIYKQCYAISR